jgi:Thioredoxin-like
MRTSRFLLSTAAVLALSLPAGAGEGLGYDPAADPFAQLAEAKTMATADHKLVLVVAGGDWCIWCHYLDGFFKKNADLDQSLHDTFVVVHANYSPENLNEMFFATLPKAVGYPHFWVLSADGAVLRSQNTAPLENGAKGYEKARIGAFIDEWRTREREGR